MSPFNLFCIHMYVLMHPNAKVFQVSYVWCLFCVFSMFTNQQMQPDWHSPSHEVEAITNRMSNHPGLPRTEPISPYVALPQMSHSPHPLAGYQQSAGSQTMYPCSATQYAHQAMQTSPILLGTVYNGRMTSTQTSPMQYMYAGTQTSPQPMVAAVPGPIPFGPSPSASSQRSSRSSCRYGYQSPEDRVCERCGETSWVTKEQFAVLRMRRKAAKYALRHMQQCQPTQSLASPYAHPVPVRSSRSQSAAALPRPLAQTAHRPAAAISPSAWRPWTTPPSNNPLDYRTVRERAETALAAQRQVQLSHRVTSTSITTQGKANIATKKE